MSENLMNLVKIIRDRKNKDEDESYTSSLLSGGLSKCMGKMEEEFGELKEALNDQSNIVHEAADTIYHILVTLEAADINFEDVLKELENRKKQSGIIEKKNRKLK
jgi:phosphoribosyl-ATP pyrophosphohydrolase